MKINTNNTKKLQAALDIANKGCSVRTIDCNDLEQAIALAEARLLEMGVSKKNWKGCDIFVSGGTVKCNSYKYRVASTRVRLLRGSSAWFMMSAARSESYPCSSYSDFYLWLSEAAKEDAARRLNGGIAL